MNNSAQRFMKSISQASSKYTEIFESNQYKILMMLISVYNLPLLKLKRC